MTAVNLSTRLPFVNEDGTLTTEAYRALSEILNRTGGPIGNAGGDTFVSADYSAIEGQARAGGDITGDTFGAAEVRAMSEMTTQPASASALLEMVLQPASELRMLDLPQATTANAPAYKKGRLYFDTTLNKARIGGATAYETLTSS